MTALRMKSSRPLFSVRCWVLPTPLTQTPLHTPWEEVCCAVATLNQHRPNEVSHLTPSSLRPSHGCQSHNERPSISSAWLTHFDSWESLGPVRSKLPLSKCHHQHIHQPYLWIRPFFPSFSCKRTIRLQKKKKINNTSWLVCLRSPVPSRSLKDREPPKICTQSQLQTGRTRKRLFSLITSYKWHACLSVVRLQPSAPNGSLSDELGVPQVLVSPSADLLTHSSLNVNRSSRLITNRERQRFLRHRGETSSSFACVFSRFNSARGQRLQPDLSPQIYLNRRGLHLRGFYFGSCKVFWEN